MLTEHYLLLKEIIDNEFRGHRNMLPLSINPSSDYEKQKLSIINELSKEKLVSIVGIKGREYIYSVTVLGKRKIAAYKPQIIKPLDKDEQITKPNFEAI